MSPTNQPPQPEFVDKRTYLATLTDQVSHLKTGDRAAVMAMALDVRQLEVAALMHALSKAAQRGADVSLAVDAYSFLVRDYTRPDWVARQQPADASHKEFTERWAALRSLKTAGGRYTIMNQVPSYTTPAIGRSHIKFAVVNNTVWIGGCNLNDPTQIDLMATWHDEQLADWLVALPERIVQAGSVRTAQQKRDEVLPTAIGAELLVDAGVRGQSKIMEHALQLIDDAEEHIMMTSQFFPTGSAVRHLAAAARRGVQIELIYNDPVAHKWPNNWILQAAQEVERLVRPRMLFVHRLPANSPYVHAKLLITEKAAMLGSHNYVEAGVRFGTAEIALLSTSKIFGAQAHKALKAQLRQ